MRNLLRRARDWFRRKPKITRARPTPTKYMISLVIGGKKYYMVWDAWVQGDDGTWHILDQLDIAVAVEEWIKGHPNDYVRVYRSGGNVAVWRVGAIDEFEVVDSFTFDLDI